MRLFCSTGRAVLGAKKVVFEEWGDKWGDKWGDIIGVTNGVTVLGFINVSILAICTIYFCFKGLFALSWAGFDRVVFGVIFRVICWFSVGLAADWVFICRKSKRKGVICRQFADNLPVIC